MKLNITIELDNAAFDPSGSEAARILRELAERFDGQHLRWRDPQMVVRDLNGNRCGEAKVTR